MFDDGQDLGARIGTAVRSTREETGWSQRELARRLGRSHSAVQRLESGGTTYLDVALATDAMRLLGIRLEFNARTLGLANRREQRDSVHAACAGYARRRLANAGWEVAVEVEIGTGRWRGWIDLLAYRAIDRTLICVEIKTRIDDLGQILRTMGWYRREAIPAALRIGWRPTTTVAVLLLLCSDENDRAVARNLELLRTSMPRSARDLQALLAAPGATAHGGAVAMIDPRSRRSDWLRASLSDGRRTPAAFADYRDAAEAIDAGGRRR